MTQGINVRQPVQPRLRECGGCGLLQTVPSLRPGMMAQCVRCRMALFSIKTHPLGHSGALTLAALVLLIVMCVTTLMSVQTAGIVLHAGLFSGPEELVRRDMAVLAIVVVFVTVIAPAIKLAGTLYVLVRLNQANPPRHLRSVFSLAERLRAWSMIEVFVLGVFVAYVKLKDLVQIDLDVGVYALLALTFVIVWADSALDRELIWNRLTPKPIVDAGPRPGNPGSAVTIGCEVCWLVSTFDKGKQHCPRCGHVVHPRKPESVGRTWALLIAAVVLYIPANYYPVLTVMQLGSGTPSTIMSGVEELLAAHMYPLAALVFFASVAVPMLKVFGLTFMLIATQRGHAGWLRDRTHLYYVIHWIGRWSMVDIFMEALLGALVRFGSVITIEPGIGAVAFCGVVILTMFAAETFDPRLMWDSVSSDAKRRRKGGS